MAHDGDMKRRNILLGSFFASMVVLGIFVNALFLLAAVASLCGIAHIFGGHGGHGEADHKHETVSSSGEKD